MKKLKAYTNVLKLRLNMKLKRDVVRNYPVVAYIEPTLFCNLHCPSCPTGLNLKLRPTVSIDEALFRSAIDEIGDYLFKLYMYNWGEPLLHKQTPEMIHYAKQHDMKIILSTNLSLKLTDDYLERLVRSGLDELTVSLDGTDAETYKKYRRNGNYDLVCENIGRIRDIKERLGVQTPKVVWQFLVFQHNEHQIDEARAIYKSVGADELVVAPAIMPLPPHNEGFEPSTLAQYNMYNAEHPVQIESARQMKKGDACSWLYGAVVLNPNGKVSPCCSVSNQQNDFGEFTTGSRFLGVWNNENYRRARRLFVEWGRKRKPANQKVKVKSHRIDGMGSGVSTNGHLICERCPIPHMQDHATLVINDVANNAALTARKAGQLRPRFRELRNYLLMGAPNLSVTIRFLGIRSRLLRLVKTQS